ncbi:MAG: tetratricopeptide repeat protein, partial [Chloroflexi bacterium]|nr:tetratricopeptide repeat protein [Chloroflexota bacterium]
PAPPTREPIPDPESVEEAPEPALLDVASIETPEGEWVDAGEPVDDIPTSTEPAVSEWIPGASLSAQPRPAIDLPPLEVVDGVPVVSLQTIELLQREVSPIVAAVKARQSVKALDINWRDPGTRAVVPRVRVQPTNVVSFVRANTMAFAIGGAIIAALLIIWGLFSAVGAVRNAIIAANTTPSATPTITLTPTITATPRVTRTPTLAANATSEPILPVGRAPRGILEEGLTPTPFAIATPHPDNPLFDRAALAFAEGRYPEALDLISEARQGSDTPDSYYFEALALAELGELAEAQAAAEAGLELDENVALLHAALGAINLRQGSIEQARVASERARTLDPALILPYVTLAQVETSQGDFDAALALIEAGKRAATPYDVNLLIAEAETQLAAQRPLDALGAINLAYYIDPANRLVTMRQADVRLRLGYNNSAIAGLETYLEQVNPQDAIIWAMLGRIYGLQNRSAAAADAFNFALSFATTDLPFVLGQRGQFYLERGDPEAALPDLDAALDATSDGTALHLARAEANLLLGNAEDALTDIEAALERRPLTTRDSILYGRILVANSQYQQAIDLASNLLPADSSDEADDETADNLNDVERAELLVIRGQALYERGAFETALTDLDAALALVESGTGHYYRGLARRELGDLDGAVFDIEWVVFWSNTFDYPFADDAADLIDTLYQEQAIARTPTATPTITPTPSPTDAP